MSSKKIYSHMLVRHLGQYLLRQPPGNGPLCPIVEPGILFYRLLGERTGPSPKTPGSRGTRVTTLKAGRR